jgi:hypothetical protein
LIAPAAGRRLHAVANDLLPESHRWECRP